MTPARAAGVRAERIEGKRLSRKELRELVEAKNGGDSLIYATEKSLKEVENETERSELMTEFTLKWGDKVVDKAWKLGDFLWTKYDEKW